MLRKHFMNGLDLTGIILTKMDGDARGGAALSMKKVTGAPIKFMGVGEKIDEFEVFHPDQACIANSWNGRCGFPGRKSSGAFG